MATFDIVIDDLAVRITNSETGDIKSYPRTGYRTELRSGVINIVDSQSSQSILRITRAEDLNSITDNRTTAGSVTPISTISEIYSIIDATATPFFFHNFAALAGDILHDPFILEDGTPNPSSLDGTGNVRVATAFPNSIGFNSITPNVDDAVLVQNLEVQGGTLNMTAESKIVFDSSGTNKTFVSSGNINVDISLSNTDSFEVTTDAGGFATAWIYAEPSYASIAHGTNEFKASATDLDLLYGGASRIKVDTTGLGFFNATPVAQPSAYIITNPVTRKSFDTTTVTLQQLAEVVSTMIGDDQDLGLKG